MWRSTWLTESLIRSRNYAYWYTVRKSIWYTVNVASFSTCKRMKRSVTFIIDTLQLWQTETNKKKTWSHLTTWASPMPPPDRSDGWWQTSAGPGHALAWAGVPCVQCRIFNPQWHSVLLMITFETVVPALFCMEPQSEEINHHPDSFIFQVTISPSCLPISAMCTPTILSLASSSLVLSVVDRCIL